MKEFFLGNFHMLNNRIVGSSCAMEVGLLIFAPWRQSITTQCWMSKVVVYSIIFDCL